MSGHSSAEPVPGWRRHLIDAGLLVVLGMLAVLAIGPAYGGARWIVASLVGLLLGVGIALASARLRLSAWLTMGAVALAYLVLGSALAVPTQAAAGVFPTLTSLRTLVVGVVACWQQSLTLAAPLGDFGGVLIVPFLSCLLVGAVGGLLRWRGRWHGLVVVPLAALFVLGTSFGTVHGVWPVVRGLVLAAGTLAWVRFGQHHSVRLHIWRRLGMTAAMVGVAGLVAGGLSFVTEPASARHVLRDYISPPFDPQAQISPLSQFRGYPENHKDDDMLTVHGLPQGARIRLATMDAYDGVVWNVAGGPTEPDGSGSFNRILPASDSPGKGEAKVRITIDKYRGVWAPTVGDPKSIQVEHGPKDIDELLFLNPATGGLAQLNGVTPAATYDEVTTVPTVPTEKQIDAATADVLAQPEPQSVPDGVADIAAKIAGDKKTAGAKADALATGFQKGYFSDGLDGQAPSRAGHGADRIRDLLDGTQLIGDAEQYAATMGLAARALGLPARVVMGWAPDKAGTVTLKGNDVTAWVEVKLHDLGWVAFDPTPDKDRAPNIKQPQPKVNPQPQVLQPPVPPQEPKLPPSPTIQAKAKPKPKHHGAQQVFAALRQIVLVGLPIVVVLAPFVTILLMKSRRRKRRRNAAEAAARVAGGWREVMDRATDLRLPYPGGGTRAETAHALHTGAHTDGVVALAGRADLAIWAPGDPTEDDVHSYWSDVDSVVGRLGREKSWFARLRARFSTASLRGKE